MRSREPCSPSGWDGSSDSLGSLVKVSIGWQIGETFIQQIGLCIDESTYSTVWSTYTLHGASIAFRDIDYKRPGFRVDVSRMKRLVKYF